MRSIACFLALVTVAAGASKIEEARSLERQGKLEAAATLLSGAVEEYRSAGDTANLARALGIAADVSIALGRYRDAIRQAGDALKLREKLAEKDRVGDDYNTIGLAYQYLGEYAPALDAYRQALDADRAAGDQEGEVTRLNNIGNVLYFQGHYSEALRSYQQGMERIQTSAGAQWIPAKRQLTIANLAVLFQRLGQEQRALEEYRELGAGAGAMPASERAQLLLNQGVLYRRLGDPVKALELYHAAQALFQTDRHADGEIGALRNLGIVLAMDLNQVPPALEAFGRARELAQRSSNRRALVQADLYRGELIRREGHLPEAEAALREVVEGAKAAGLVEEHWKALFGMGQAAESSGRLAEAEADYREAVGIIESVRTGLRLTALRSDFLADKRDVYDALIALRLRDARTTPAEILQWMERSRARTLLDRVRGKVPLAEARPEAIAGLLPAGGVLAEYWLGKNQAAAVWVTRSGSGLVRFDSPAFDGRMLAGIPLAKSLIVVPDGALSTLPFETFTIPGSKELLVERCEVSYLPSARFLRRGTRKKWLAPWSAEVVALADPAVSGDSLGEQWAALPESAKEARTIAALLPGKAGIHLGADMRKRYLAGIGAPLLHLATHAIVDPESPDRSRILFSNDYLLQEEVYDLNLAPVDLVTLSACETARGKLVRGENVQAFGQAFLAAGASAVVTTLWRVADRATADFMGQFYYALAHGETKAGALRSAKLRFLRSNSPLSDARYWAAFILTGDGSSTIPRAVPWSWVLGAVGVLAALAGIIGSRFSSARRKG